MNNRSRRRIQCSLALAGTAALILAGCGAGGDADNSAEEAPADRLAEGGELLLWGWGNAVEPLVEGFMDEHPQVDIEFANVGTGVDHYTAVENAVAAGSGIPDIIVMEYLALPQFVLNGTLVDLSGFGAGNHGDEFTPGTWNAVQYGEGIYGLPMSSGPMALFYNETVFDEHDLEVPETWEEYLETGRELREANSDVYLTSDTGDASFMQGLAWQQGGVPYQSEGEDLTIDLGIPEVANVNELWQQMIDDDLLAPIAGWSDEWYQGLGDGTIATLISAAWMPANFESGVEAAAGDWRVAPLPQWEAGAHASAELGGSGLSVVEASENQELAYAFVEWATAGDGVEARLHETYPATTSAVESQELLDLESEYFGGQRINEVFADSAASVPDNWEFLPFQVYANSIYNDHVAGAYTGGEDLADGVRAWEDALITYGNDQGFSVNE